MSTVNRRKPRYSLLGLLALTAIVALAVSYIQTTKQLRATKSELDVAQRKLRELRIRDPNVVSAISLPTFAPMEWRWRIHLPQGQSFRLRSAFKEIPASGLPQESDTYDHVFYDGYGVPLASTEPFTFTLRLVKTDGGAWVFETQNPARGMMKQIGPIPDWLNSRDGEQSSPDFTDWTQEVAGTDRAASGSDSSPLVLLRYRKSRREGLQEKRPQPGLAQGMMFWIERVDDR